MTFFVGLHQPSDCRRFERSFVSINRLRTRQSDFAVRDWMLDSGAFSELARFGRYREGVEEYARQIARWSRCGNLLAAVTQDYMCEPIMLAKTGLTVARHQRLTVERFVALRRLVDAAYIMPVLQRSSSLHAHDVLLRFLRRRRFRARARRSRVRGLQRSPSRRARGLSFPLP